MGGFVQHSPSYPLTHVTRPHTCPIGLRLWDLRSNSTKCAAVSNTGSGLFVTWCPDGSSYAVMNSDNVLSVIDVRKAGKIVRSHKFPMEVGGHETLGRDRGPLVRRKEGRNPPERGVY